METPDFSDITIIDSEGQQVVVDYEPRCNDGTPLDHLIANFVKAKFARTQSTKTAKAYFDTIQAFRQFLAERGVHLIEPTQGKTIDEVDVFRVKIADLARDFAILSARPGRLVAKSTRNQRIAILSSFYHYAVLNRKISFANPLEMVERSRIEAYASAKALDPQEVQQRLTILLEKPKRTIEEKRDLALLMLYLATGRRAQEVQRLQVGDARIVAIGNEEVITLTFRHMKGGKEVEQALNAKVSALLLDYMRSYYGPALYTLKHAPLWVNLSTVPMNTKQREKWERMGKPEHIPLEYQAIRNVFQKYLDVSKVHTGRHTFTRIVKRAGATLEERQQMLMHSSPVTTQMYDRQEARGNNPYLDKITEMLGL